MALISLSEIFAPKTIFHSENDLDGDDKMGADNEDDDHRGNLLESFFLLPEELRPISLIVSNTVDLQNIILTWW